MSKTYQAFEEALINYAAAKQALEEATEAQKTAYKKYQNSSTQEMYFENRLAYLDKVEEERKANCMVEVTREKMIDANKALEVETAAEAYFENAEDPGVCIPWQEILLRRREIKFYSKEEKPAMRRAEKEAKRQAKAQRKAEKEAEKEAKRQAKAQRKAEKIINAKARKFFAEETKRQADAENEMIQMSPINQIY